MRKMVKFMTVDIRLPVTQLLVTCILHISSEPDELHCKPDTSASSDWCYYLLTKELTYQETQEECRKLDLFLPVVENETHNRQVYSILAELDVPVDEVYLGAYLVGDVGAANCYTYSFSSREYRSNISCFDTLPKFTCFSPEDEYTQRSISSYSANWFDATQKCKIQEKILYPEDLNVTVIGGSTWPEVWVGQRDGGWKWNTGDIASAIEYYNWSPDQTEESNRCITMSAGDGSWRTADCSEERRSVCVTDRKVQPTSKFEERVKKDETNIGLVVGLCVAGLVVIAAIFVVIVCIVLRKKRTRPPKSYGNPEPQDKVRVNLSSQPAARRTSNREDWFVDFTKRTPHQHTGSEQDNRHIETSNPGYRDSTVSDIDHIDGELLSHGQHQVNENHGYCMVNGSNYENVNADDKNGNVIDGKDGDVVITDSEMYNTTKRY